MEHRRNAICHVEIALALVSVNDAVLALGTLKQAFTTDVGPILAMARHRAGGAIDPVAAYRASGYRQRAAEKRPATGRVAAGMLADFALLSDDPLRLPRQRFAPIVHHHGDLALDIAWDATRARASISAIVEEIERINKWDVLVNEKGEEYLGKMELIALCLSPGN